MWIRVAILRIVAGIGLCTQALASGVVSVDDLERTIASQIRQVPEFADIAATAESRGYRVFLTGGSAASFADFAKHQLLAAEGKIQVPPERLKNALYNVILPDQDIDIAITRADGTPESVEDIQWMRNWVESKYPYLLGNDKTRWDVLGLQTAQPHEPGRAPRMALLNNPDFVDQNNDSLSIGVLELTARADGAPVVGELIETGRPATLFLEDVAGETLTYLHSASHSKTERAISGMNPEILSVIRTLTKAFQFQKKILPEDLEKMKKIIQQFDPSSIKQPSYAYNWIQGKAIALIVNAYDPELAMKTIEELGLKKKLIALNPAGIKHIDSLSWWLSKVPLSASPQKSGLSWLIQGKTAKELGITTVAHETDAGAHRAITWRFDGKPRAFSSRKTGVGESARLGNGFYTQMGTKVEGFYTSGEGHIVVMDVDPSAREGVDFRVGENGAVVWKNVEKLKLRGADPVYPNKLGCATSSRQTLALLTAIIQNSYQPKWQRSLAAMKAGFHENTPKMISHAKWIGGGLAVVGGIHYGTKWAVDWMKPDEDKP